MVIRFVRMRKTLFGNMSRGSEVHHHHLQVYRGNVLTPARMQRSAASADILTIYL